MNNAQFSKLFLAFSGLFLLLLVTAPSASNNWEIETLHKGGSPSFAQLELTGGVPAVAYTTENGTFLAEKNTVKLPVLKSIHEYIADPGWSKEVINSSSTSGGYLSLKTVAGSLAVAYQDAELGDGKLIYSERKGSEWSTDVVDSVAGTGLGTGMYASLTSVEGDPVILYHTSQNNQFVKAERVNGTWERKVLGKDEGWFISTESCGEKAFAVYRSREGEDLRKAIIDDSGFNSENLSYRTSSMPSVDASNCEFRAGIFASDNQEVVYLNGETDESIGSGTFSTTSMEYGEEPAFSYYVQGRGLVYSQKTDEGWAQDLVDEEAVNYAGRYNDLELTSSGNPVIAYTTSSTVKIAQKHSQNTQVVQRLLLLGLSISTLIAVFFGIRSDESYVSTCKNYIKSPE